MEEVIKYGGGSADSSVTLPTLLALVTTLVLVARLPFKQVIVAVLAFAVLVPGGQQFYVAGVHLYVYRIVILAGLARVWWSGGHEEGRLAGGWNAIDSAFSLYVLIRGVSFVLQHLDSGAVIHEVGFVWDTLGGYFLMRLLIGDSADIERALKCLSWIFAVLALCMLAEQIFKVNVFSYLGSQRVPEVRNGKVRSIGSFAHALPAGTTGAAMLPLFMFLWHRSRHRAAAVLGMTSATVMTVTAHSSSPLLAYAAGIIGLLFWRLRRSMRRVRWATGLSLLMLHLVMKAPVWFLVARVDLTGSSSSYHRANLIDQFIRHFSDWWLIGTPSSYSWGWSLWDVQNQYVSVGVGGGLVALSCFVAVIILSFSRIGRARECSLDEQQERCSWAIGASLFSYMIAFLGVNLFDQSRVLWFMLLGSISAFGAAACFPEGDRTGERVQVDCG